MKDNSHLVMKDDTKQFKRMILILGFMGFLANGDNYAVAPLLINISKDLNITITQTGLSVTSYMLFFGVFTIFFGPLGDRFGKTRVIDRLDIRGGYKKAFNNKALVRVIGTIFLVGFCVFGTFTYSGQFVNDHTGYNTLFVGLILTIFGIGTVIGGRLAPDLRLKYNEKFVPSAAILGVVSLGLLSLSKTPLLISIGLFGFGYAFISIHSTLTIIAQGLMPELRGTVMSLVSFALFGGGALGTFVNGRVLELSGFSAIYGLASVLMLIVFYMTSKVIDVSIHTTEEGAYPG